MQIFHLGWRVSYCAWPLPPSRQRQKHLVSLFGFWTQHIPHLCLLLLPKYQVTRKAAKLWVGPGTWESSSTGQGGCPGCLPLEPCDPSESMVLKVSVADRDVVWTYRCITEDFDSPFSFWARLHHYLQTSILPFKRQLFACYWALVETEHQTMSHQVIMWLELPITSWAIIISPTST